VLSGINCDICCNVSNFIWFMLQLLQNKTKFLVDIPDVCVRVRLNVSICVLIKMGTAAAPVKEPLPSNCRAQNAHRVRTFCDVLLETQNI
jgi:hypothetical protein